VDELAIQPNENPTVTPFAFRYPPSAGIWKELICASDEQNLRRLRAIAAEGICINKLWIPHLAAVDEAMQNIGLQTSGTCMAG